MIEEQNAVLQHLVSVEATVQKVYLESIPREKWGEGISLLTDNAHEGNENLEFYYYEGDQLVLKSGNASDPGLDSAGRSSLLASGKPLFDEQQYNMYAATALGDGMLLSMYRAVGALSAMNVRSLTGAEKLTGSSELIAYADDTGAVYSLSGDGITDSNIHDPQYREIFDNYVPAGSEDWGFFEILDNRGKYIMSTVELADNLKLSAYFSVEECFKTALYEMLLPAVLFVLGTAVLTLGALRSRLVRDPVRAVGEYTCLHGNIYIDKVIIKRILALFAVCTLITAVSACYTSALVFLSSENTEANNKLDSLLKDDIYTEDSREFYTELREEMLMNILDELTLVIENSEALRTDESLKEINDLFEKCESITIYDSNGRSEASSLGYTGYVLGIGEAESNGNKVISVLESDSPSILIDADGDEGDLDYYATKCRFNSGFILYAVHDNEFQDIIDRLNEAVLITEEDFGNSDLLYYDQNNSSKLYVSYAGTGDLVTVENKLTAGQLSDNYFGTCSVAGHKYYINVRADSNHEGNYYISAGQLGDIVQSIATVGIFFVLSITVLLLLEICLFAPFSLDHRSIISIESKEEEDDEGDGRAAHIKINERKQRRKNAEEEGPLRLKKEGKLNELYELGNDLMTRDFSGYIGMLSKGCIVIFLVFLVFELLTENDTGFLVRYLFNTEWERGFNLFSITLVIITISIVWPVSILLQRIVLIISNNTGSAGLTIGKMVISLIKFASLVIIIILSLKEFGVETIQIMAGAGVTSVIFGIGAQSTIGDILSGLFIIFEGYFHVGDIVEFDDWNGVIKEIGVRSTCLESFGHADDFRNIRVINNSDFKDVINLSVCLSKAAIVLRIPFDVDINEVRRVYETKVDEIRAAVPSMIDGPFWGGVSGYGDGGKEVIIVAKCYQKDKRKVEFRMRQIVGEAFEREGFGVPHPNWYVADPKKEQTKLQSAEPDKVHDIYD